MRKVLMKTVALVLSFALAVPTVAFAEESKLEPVGEIASIPGTTRIIEEYNSSFLSVSGHALADGNIHDRTEYYGTSYHKVCETEEEFLKAIVDAKSGKVKIIEVVDDMNLGWLEISAEARNSGCIEPYVDSLTSAPPHSSPSLMASGISTVTVQGVSGLTIYSPNGSIIRHAEFKLQESATDIVIRNLAFDEVYEWDDTQKGSGVRGGNGYRKRTGWTNIKVNGAHDVWIDHCNFGFSFDGNVDIERSSQGITISWCQFGIIDYSKEGSIYKTVSYLENLYQNDKEHSFIIYSACRDAGMTPFQMMQLMAYHKKVHLVSREDEEQPRSMVSFMYNHYENCGSRMPLCGGANNEMINCYFDNRDFYTVLNHIRAHDIGKAIKEVSGYYDFPLYALNVREGGSVGADTCVFQNVESPVTDYNYFRYEYGEVTTPEQFLKDGELIVVNSEFSFTEYETEINPLTNTYRELETESYRGSSYDNNGDNPITREYTFTGSTYMDFKWVVNDGVLPYEYKVVPLDDVREVISTYSGSGMIEMDSKDWLKVQYDADFKTDLVKYDAKSEKLTLSRDSVSVERGKIYQIDAKVYPNNAADTSVFWSSSDENVATVNDAGTIKAIGKGNAVITATNSDGTLTDKTEIKVVVAPEEISLEKKNRTIYMDDVVKLLYDIAPEDTDYKGVKFSSSNTKVVKIDDEGVLTPVTAGKATITITSDYNESVSAKCTITVKEGNNPDPTEPPAPAAKLGDVDGNGTVDATDALEVLKSAAKLVIMADGQLEVADVNKDNKVDASDALDILKVAAKLMEFDE